MKDTLGQKIFEHIRNNFLEFWVLGNGGCLGQNSKSILA